MAKINEGSFRDWNDGETVKARDYKQEREIMRTAINNTYDRFIEEESELQQLEVEVRQQGDYALAQGDYAKGQGNAVQQALEKSVNLLKSPTKPDGIVEGRLWLDTSDNAYQGTVFNDLSSQLAQTEQDIKGRGYNIERYKHLVTNNDWTIAIQTLVNDLPEHGGVIHFPDGVFNISQTIVIPKVVNRIKAVIFKGLKVQEVSSSLSGNNRGVTKLNFTGQGTMFDLRGGDNSEIESRVSFVDIALVCSNDNKAGTLAINAHNYTGGVIENVFVNGFESGIVVSGYAYYSTFERIVFRSNTGTAFAIGLMNGATIDKCRFEGNNTGLRLNSSGRTCNIRGCTFEANNIGLDADRTRQVNLFGCHFEHHTTSIYMRSMDSDPNGYQANVNLYGSSISIDGTSTSAILCVATGSGVVVNLDGCMFANRSAAATVIVGTVGSIVNRPRVISKNVSWFDIASGLLELPIVHTASRSTRYEFDRQVINNQTFTNGTTAPTTGTWRQGDIVWRTNAIAGRNVGWQCITAGTPGVWREFGMLNVE